jgi:hypothetical protein
VRCVVCAVEAVVAVAPRVSLGGSVTVDDTGMHGSNACAPIHPAGADCRSTMLNSNIPIRDLSRSLLGKERLASVTAAAPAYEQWRSVRSGRGFPDAKCDAVQHGRLSRWMRIQQVLII